MMGRRKVLKLYFWDNVDFDLFLEKSQKNIDDKMKRNDYSVICGIIFRYIVWNIEIKKGIISTSGIRYFCCF